MTIYYRQDSRGNDYQVWKQRQENSCAVASIWMARGLARQMSFAESEWELAWRIYGHAVQGLPWGQEPFDAAMTGPMSLDPQSHDNDQNTFYNMFARAGTFANQVATALRGDGFSVNHVTTTGTPLRLVTGNLGTTTPAIVLVGWYFRQQNQNVRAGGHFVVAADNIGRRIVYLDPWSGTLYEYANNRTYTPPYKRGLQPPITGLIEEVLYISE